MVNVNFSAKRKGHYKQTPHECSPSHKLELLTQLPALSYDKNVYLWKIYIPEIGIFDKLVYITKNLSFSDII